MSRKKEDTKAVPPSVIGNGNEIFSLYRIHLKEGQRPKEGNVGEVRVNEEMMHRNGIANPVGKMSFHVNRTDYLILSSRYLSEIESLPG